MFQFETNSGDQLLYEIIVPRNVRATLRYYSQTNRLGSLKILGPGRWRRGGRLPFWHLVQFLHVLRKPSGREAQMTVYYRVKSKAGPQPNKAA